MLTTKLFIDEIRVGERRREDYGDLDGLAESINRFGLFHPVVVDDRQNLVAGGRRLEACKLLGWAEIDCRQFNDLTEDERREIELEENLRRKDLTPFEVSRQLTGKAAKVADLISSQSAEIKNPENNPKNAGRQSTYAAPKKDVAQALGVSTGALVKAEQHVEAVTKYPELSVVPTQSGAISAAKRLDEMPEPERRSALSSIAEGGKKAVAAITGRASAPKVKSPGSKYAASLSQIQVFITSIKSVGAEELTANWTDRETLDFLRDLREALGGLSDVISDLESVLREMERRAG